MTRTALPPFRSAAWPASAVLLATVLGLSPAVAQDQSTKDMWGSFRDFFRERGVMIATQGAVDQGETLALTDVRIFSLTDPEDFFIDIPQMQVGQADGLLVLTPSPEFTATARGGRDTRVFTITHDGAIQTAVSTESITLNMDFGTLALALTSAMRGQTALDESFDVRMGTVDLDVAVTRAGSADIALSTQTLNYGYHLGPEQLEGPLGQSASFVGEEFSLTLVGRGLDALETVDQAASPTQHLHDAGFSVQMDMRFGPGAGTGTVGLGGMPVELTTESGPGEFSLGFVDGRADMNGVVNGLAYSIDSGPFPGSATADTMSFGFGAPLAVLPEEQQAYYRIALENLVVTSPALAMAGLQDFDGETLNLSIDLTADARLTEALSERAMERAQPPFEVSTVTLANLLLAVGQASLTGSGSFTFEGGMQASMQQDLPNGTGDFLFELIGGNGFLQRLVSAGLVPQDQVFVAQMMMNGLGRSVGEDHLRSEVAIRPGGVVTVNGAPIPF